MEDCLILSLSTPYQDILLLTNHLLPVCYFWFWLKGIEYKPSCAQLSTLYNFFCDVVDITGQGVSLILVCNICLK